MKIKTIAAVVIVNAATSFADDGSIQGKQKDEKRAQQQALQADIRAAQLKQQDINSQLSKAQAHNDTGKLGNLYQQRDANSQIISTKQSQLSKSKTGQ